MALMAPMVNRAAEAGGSGYTVSRPGTDPVLIRHGAEGNDGATVSRAPQRRAGPATR